MLAQQHGLTRYAVDDAFSAHVGRLQPTRHPALTRWLARSWDERWMQPVDLLLVEAIAIYREHFSLVLEDLMALPADLEVLAEGTALLPDLMEPWLQTPGHGVWVAPTPAFQHAHYAARPWIRNILAQCSEPEIAFHNWMERDSRFAQWVVNEARSRHYATLIVDGRQTIVENARWVAAALGLSGARASHPADG